MSNAACVETRNLTKSYDEKFTLDIPHLAILEGEIFCLVGPTGAGKSTLLRLIAALETPTQGKVLMDGAPMDGTTPVETRRQLAMVFQRPVLLSGTARTNVAYGLRLRGKSNDSADRVERMLDRLRLSHVADQAAETLSGGQTQLVALARALVLKPKLLLLDEPSANLDPAHVALVEEVVAETNAEHGTTIVWTTHNLFQAKRVANRTALLLDGKLVEEAPTETFFESPADPRTADFVQGRMIY